MIEEIRGMKKKRKLCLSTDEWTSVANKRYSNVNIHDGERTLNLGLKRMKGTMRALQCAELIIQTLREFEIDCEKDVLSVGTDAASVMIAMAKILHLHNQLCFAHGAHLAVIDTFFKDPKKPPARRGRPRTVTNVIDESIIVVEDCDVIITQSQAPTLDTGTAGTSNEPEDNDGDDWVNKFEVEEEIIVAPLTDEFNISSLVEKVRTVTRMFRKSPTKTDNGLRAATETILNQELMLELDSPTRWNSTITMISKFLRLYRGGVLQLALTNISVDSVFTEEEIGTLTAVEEALKPLNEVIEALCRRDSNLLKADTIFSLVLEELDNQNSPIARKLSLNLSKRIKERRTMASKVLQHLHSSNRVSLHHSFEYATREEINKYIADLWDKFHPREEDSAETEEEEVPLTNGANFKERLTYAIERDCGPQKILHRGQLDTKRTVHEEMYCFNSTGVKGKILSFVYTNLLSIPPTSVEAERNFSAAGRTCTKIRSKLTDKSMDTLSALRSYFVRKKNEMSAQD